MQDQVGRQESVGAEQRFIRIGENGYDPGMGDVPLAGGDSPPVTKISVTEVPGAPKPAKRGAADGEGPTVHARGRDEVMPGR